MEERGLYYVVSHTKMVPVTEVERIRLNSLGFDVNGKYFGVGDPVFFVDVTDDRREVRCYFRCKTLAKARKLVQDAFSQRDRKPVYAP